MSSTSAVTSAASTTPTSTGSASKGEGATSFRDVLAKNDQHVAVKGHDYRKIVKGDHEGWYQNRSGNARDGELFRIVRRDGRQFHVYGSGADRTIVEVVRKDAPTGGTQAATDKPAEKTSEKTTGKSSSGVVTTAASTSPSPSTYGTSGGLQASP